ncbi:hypothetical protein [Methanosarcina sp. UBA5]|uniref:hypothetical protein n=1 Tax=Methanosarcina sp. UBA5 TaxID=1915593 RepID=UPI0025F5F020|nr:hypothetical protein [Methanosarcina sp. UBA5]
MNKKKTISLILFVLLASMVAVGCTGSNKEKTASQDAAWNESFHNNLALLHTDLNNSINAMNLTNDFNDTSFIMAGQNMIEDSQNALNENNQFTVSPNLQEAQKEWALGLNDSISLGKCLLNMSNNSKNNNETALNEDVENMYSLGSSMSAHMNRAATLAKIAQDNEKSNSQKE